MADAISRAGRFVKQPTGYRAFIPADLPPEPPINLDTTLSAALSRADQAVGRLDGTIYTLTDADLFVAMYVRQEAVLSSQEEKLGITYFTANKLIRQFEAIGLLEEVIGGKRN